MSYRERHTRSGSAAGPRRDGEVRVACGTQAMFYRIEPSEAEGFATWLRLCYANQMMRLRLIGAWPEYRLVWDEDTRVPGPD